MQLSDKGLSLIKTFEALLLNPYLCSAKRVTIGYGHLCKDGEDYLDGHSVKTIKEWIEKSESYKLIGRSRIKYAKQIEITEDKAESLLRVDVASSVYYVNKLIQTELNQNQFDALVSFTFNLGAANLQSSTLRMKLNRREYIGAANEFCRWNKVRVGGILTPSTGLTKRRLKEAELFMSIKRDIQKPDTSKQRLSL